MGFNDSGNHNIKKSPILHKVTVEVRADRMIHVVPDQTLNPQVPQHAAMILDMLCSGAAAFARKRVPNFEERLIEEVSKPGLIVAH